MAVMSDRPARSRCLFVLRASSGTRGVLDCSVSGGGWAVDAGALGVLALLALHGWWRCALGRDHQAGVVEPAVRGIAHCGGDACGCWLLRECGACGTALVAASVSVLFSLLLFLPRPWSFVRPVFTGWCWLKMAAMAASAHTRRWAVRSVLPLVGVPSALAWGDLGVALAMPACGCGTSARYSALGSVASCGGTARCDNRLSRVPLRGAGGQSASSVWRACASAIRCLGEIS